MARFIGRFAAYAMLLAVVFAAGQALWTQAGLDDLAGLAEVRAGGSLALMLAPLVLAFVGALSRRVAMFVLCFLIGATLSAPFAFMRAGWG